MRYSSLCLAAVIGCFVVLTSCATSGFASPPVKTIGDDQEFLQARARVVSKLGRVDGAQADDLRRKLLFP